MKINKMFEMKGENFFRNEEEKIVIESLVKNSTSTIISLGGGAFLNEIIRSHVISDSISFWLDDKITTIFNRLNKSYKRPLFKKNKFKDLPYPIIVARYITFKRTYDNDNNVILIIQYKFYNFFILIGILTLTFRNVDPKYTLNTEIVGGMAN